MLAVDPRDLRKAAGKGADAVLRTPKREGSLGSLGLDPAAIGQAMRDAEDGKWQGFADLAWFIGHYVRRDARLRGDADKRRRKTVKWPWSIDAADDDPRGEEIAEAAEAMLKRIPRFRQALKELAVAPIVGVAAVEILGEIDKGGLLAYRGLEGRPAWALREKADGAWEWRGKDGWEDVQPGRLAVYKVTEQGDHFTSGLMWPLIWCACFKTFSVKDWLAFMEVYGVPLRVGKYPDHYDVDSPQVETLARAVIDIASDAGVVIPETMKIEFVEAMKGGSGDAFKGAAEFFDAQASQLLLGGTLTTDAGDKGARSLGEVQQDETHEIVEFDAADLAEFVTNDLLKPWVIANYGERDGYPSFVFNTVRDADISKKWTIASGMLDRSIPLDAAWVYDTFAPEGRPVEGADVLVKVAGVPAPTPTPTDGGPSAVSEMESRTFGRLRRALDPGDLVSIFESGTGGPATPADRLVDGLADAAARQTAVARAALRAAVLRAAETAVSPDGVAVGMRNAEGRAALRDFNEAFVEPLSQTVAVLVVAGAIDAADEARAQGVEVEPGDLLGDVIDALRSEGPVATTVAMLRPAGLVSVMQLTLDGGLPKLAKDAEGRIAWAAVTPERALEYWLKKIAATSDQWAKLDDAAKAYAFTIAGVESESVIAAASEGIRAALENGETVRDFIRRVREAETEDPLVAEERDTEHLRFVFRENMLTSYAAGREAAQASPGVRRYLPYFVYKHAGDYPGNKNARAEHAALDGMTAPADDPVWERYTPRNGYGCRCRRNAIRKMAEGAKTPADVALPELPEGFDRSALAYMQTTVQGGRP